MASRGKTQKSKSQNGHAGREQLLELAKSNPWHLFNVGEIRIIFNIGEQTMIRFRKLSQRDQTTDPWINDLTRPEKFEVWLWGKRIELEMQHKEL